MGTLEIRVASDHPAAQGHFPGNPIVPGAVLLAEALCAAGAALGRDLSRCRIASAKFPSPSRPGDRIDLEFSATNAGLALLGCVAGRPVLKVELACGPRPIPD